MTSTRVKFPEVKYFPLRGLGLLFSSPFEMVSTFSNYHLLFQMPPIAILMLTLILICLKYRVGHCGKKPFSKFAAETD